MCVMCKALRGAKLTIDVPLPYSIQTITYRIDKPCFQMTMYMHADGLVFRREFISAVHAAFHHLIFLNCNRCGNDTCSCDPTAMHNLLDERAYVAPINQDLAPLFAFLRQCFADWCPYSAEYIIKAMEDIEDDADCLIDLIPSGQYVFARIDCCDVVEDGFQTLNGLHKHHHCKRWHLVHCEDVAAVEENPFVIKVYNPPCLAACGYTSVHCAYHDRNAAEQSSEQLSAFVHVRETALFARIMRQGHVITDVEASEAFALRVIKDCEVDMIRVLRKIRKNRINKIKRKLSKKRRIDKDVNTAFPIAAELLLPQDVKTIDIAFRIADELLLPEEEEVKDDDEAEACAICLDADRDMRFLPCGHACTCFSCCSSLLELNDATCILCRAPIESTLMVMHKTGQHEEEEEEAVAQEEEEEVDGAQESLERLIIMQTRREHGSGRKS